MSVAYEGICVEFGIKNNIGFPTFKLLTNTKTML